MMDCRVDIPSLCEKCPNTEFFLVRISRIRTENLKDTEYLSVFSPNKRKYGPEKTRYFDTFHALTVLDIYYQNLYMRIASLVAELQREDLRRLENIRKISNLGRNTA